MVAHHLPIAIFHTAAHAAREAPAGYVMAWLMHLHLVKLGGGFGSRRFSLGRAHV